jgi:hypothetical protein
MTNNRTMESLADGMQGKGEGCLLAKRVDDYAACIELLGKAYIVCAVVHL